MATEVVEAIERQLRDGFTFFANNPQGIELAERICEAVPVPSSCATFRPVARPICLRSAWRAHTGRDLIIKFEGGYHGMSDEGQMSLSPTGCALPRG